MIVLCLGASSSGALAAVAAAAHRRPVKSELVRGPVRDTPTLLGHSN